MKKFSIIALAIIMAVAFVACGRKKDNNETTVPTTTAATTTPTTTAPTILPDPTLGTNIPDPSVDTTMPDMTDGTDMTENQNARSPMS